MKRFTLLLMALLICACDSATTPTQTPPTNSAATLIPTPTAPAFNPTATPQPGFTLIPNTPNTALPPTETPAPCNNDAVFTADLTVPDDSQLLPGAPIDKRSQIQNTVTCNLDNRYRISFTEANLLNG